MRLTGKHLLRIDSPAPPSPVVSDEIVQTYKNTIEQQNTQIKSLEEKVAELEASLHALVSCIGFV